jgi:hypothetical protein
MIDWHSQRMRTVCLGLALWALASIYFAVNTLPIRLVVDLVTDSADTAQLFYANDGRWNESASQARPLQPGWNRVIFVLPFQRIGTHVRFDPGQRATTYRILHMHWTRGGIEQVVPLDALTNPRGDVGRMTLADGHLDLTSNDNDPQSIAPVPDWKWWVVSSGLSLGLSLLGLLAVYVCDRLKIGLLRIAVTFLGVCALYYFAATLALGPHLPLYDDWRYFLPGRFNLIDGGFEWLLCTTNDTYALTLLDFFALKLSNADFFWVRAVAVALLMLQLVIQYRVISKTENTRPAVAAIGVALGIWSLVSGAYWGGTGVAYQQALPTIFGTLLLAHLIAPDGTLRPRVSISLLVLYCVGSGLSYISGSVLILSLGVASLLITDWRSAVSASRRVSWILLGFGVILLLLQLTLVTRQQGSLLEHNHAVASVYPNDIRFWLFLFSLYGRALGYTGLSPVTDMLLATLILFPAILFGIERLQALRGKSIPHTPNAVQLLTLYAGIASAAYSAIVAFGRSGFIPADSSIVDIVSLGKSRFHFWPIATMLPYVWLGWAEIAQRFRRYATVFNATIATLMLMPKSFLAFAYSENLVAMDAIAKTGAHCVVAQLTDIEAGHPVVCVDLTGIAYDIGPVVTHMHALNSPVYATLIEQGQFEVRKHQGSN